MIWRLAPVLLDEQPALCGHERLGLSAGHERLTAATRLKASIPGTSATATRAGRGRASAAERGRRRGPAGAERHVGTRLAVDVRDAVAVIDQAQPGSAGLLRARLADRLEVLGQEEPVDVRSSYPAPLRREGVVERQLIERVGVGGDAAEVARGRMYQAVSPGAAVAVVEAAANVTRLSTESAIERRMGEAPLS